MKKLYDKIFSLKLFQKIRGLPLVGKLLSYEILSYLFFGVMTTVVNFVVFYLSDKVLGTQALTEFTIFSHIFKITLEDISTGIAWLAAVIFAYVTNKLWVFESRSVKPAVVFRELASFFGARIMSFVIFESIGFMLLRNILINLSLGSETICKWVAKIAISVFVVIFNYVMSKLIVFKKNIKGGKENASKGN